MGLDHAVRNPPVYGESVLSIRQLLIRKMDCLSERLRLICVVSVLLSFGAGASTQFLSAERLAPQNRARTAAGNDRISENNTAKIGDAEILPVQGNISMVAGAGGNITVQAGGDGVLLVDSGSAVMAEKVIQLVRPLSKGQVTYIINTDDRSDHVGGNEYFAKTARPQAITRFLEATVMIVSFNTVLDRLSAPTGHTAPMPEKAWPNDTYSMAEKNVYFNGEGIQILHQPGTTDGNSIVYFRRSDVISTGDIVDPTGYPIIDLKAGGSLQNVLEGLNRLKRMAIPADHEEDGTLIVPGHGRISHVADLAVYMPCRAPTISNAPRYEEVP